MLIVFGTRPEAIKLAGLISALVEDVSHFETKLCVSAQQREMLDQVLETFDIRPDFDLNLMQPGQNLSELTSRLISSISLVMSTFKPDVVIVHGDTTTAFAAALCGFYQGVPVGHVEAGMRTYNLQSPFPEEFNRQIIGRLARWHFAPTDSSRTNLLSEGVNPDRIYVTGNTVIDTLKIMTEKIQSSDESIKAIRNELASKVPISVTETSFILVTGHRRESFGSGFLELCKAIKEISELYPNIHIVYPVHLNPNVQAPVMELLSGISNVHLLTPLKYEHLVMLLLGCKFVITDSGGIQEEAPYLGKPVLVTRDTTERPESVNAGTARIVGTSSARIVKAASELIENADLYSAMSSAHSHYGNGTAVEQIIDVLRKS